MQNTKAGEIIAESEAYLPTREVDQERLQKGLLDDVLILTWDSRNGLHYPKEVVARDIRHYEGAKVNLDHRSLPAGSNGEINDVPVSSRFGSLQNCRVVSEGLRATLKFNPHHSFAKEFMWWATNDPKGVGMSHFARVSKSPQNRNGKVVNVVESILQVASVDIVADPATTTGLFSESARNRIVRESAGETGTTLDEMTTEDTTETPEDNMETPDVIGASLTDKATLSDFLSELLMASPVTGEEKSQVLADLMSAMEMNEDGQDVTAIPMTDMPPAMESLTLKRLRGRGRLGQWASAQLLSDKIVRESLNKEKELDLVIESFGLSSEMVSESLRSELLELPESLQRTVLSARTVGRAVPTSAGPRSGGNYDAKKNADETDWDRV